MNEQSERVILWPRMLTRLLYFVLIITSESKPQSKHSPVAVWADEIESWSPVNGKVASPAPAAVWADEIDIELSDRSSDKINDEHNSTPVIEKSPIDRIFQAGKYFIFDRSYLLLLS